mgnify:CR=1 FL=1
MQNPDNIAAFRIVTIGQGTVGKSSLILRLVNNTFDEFEAPTIAASFQSYIRVIHGIKLEMQIWDTAGQERYRSLNQAYYRNASAAIAVFSMTARESLTLLQKEIELYHSIAGESALVYIAANKYDLQSEFDVEIKDAVKWAEQNHYKLYFTSAKSGYNVNQLFNCLAEDLYHLSQSKDIKGVNKNQLIPISNNAEHSSCC